MLKITVLHTELDEFVNALSGFSLLLELDGKRLLLDTSQSNDYLKNAKRAGINLRDVEMVVLSHGHWDHTNGLKFIDWPVTVVAHPDCFEEKQKGERFTGAPLRKNEVEERFKLILSSTPIEVVHSLFFLGEVPKTNDFEAISPVGVHQGGKDDFALDDSAIAIKTAKGLVIITGCGHSGICNSIDYAKKVTGEKKILAVIGGFHLFDNQKTDKTIDYFKKHKLDRVYPMHCFDTYAFSEFKKIGAKRLMTLESVTFD